MKGRLEPRFDQLTLSSLPPALHISCFIANLVLHDADLAVEEALRATKVDHMYLRYCDDMVMLAETEHACDAGFFAYLAVLEKLGLPFHPPATVAYQDSASRKAYWKEKSKAPYLLSEENVRWFGFVGYQIQHNGRTRVRPSSIEKEILSQHETVDRIMYEIRKCGRDESGRYQLPRSYSSILTRTKKRLLAHAVGKELKVPSNIHDASKCWAVGFKGICNEVSYTNRIRNLDRQRNRQLGRLSKFLDTRCSMDIAATESIKLKPPKLCGRTYSYQAHLERKPTPS